MIYKEFSYLKEKPPELWMGNFVTQTPETQVLRNFRYNSVELMNLKAKCVLSQTQYVMKEISFENCVHSRIETRATTVEIRRNEAACIEESKLY